MATEIALTKAQRNSIITLKDVADLSERTQERLTTGRRVNSVIDDAVAYFQAKGLSDRADDFDVKKSNIDQGISAMRTALDGIDAIDQLLKQMKGMAEATKSQSTEARATATEQFIEIGHQISELIEDASYQGLNLMNRTANKLDISFSERTTSRLIFNAFDFNSTVAGAERSIFTTAAYDPALNFRSLSIVIGWSSGASYMEMSAGTVLSFSNIGVLNTAVAIANRAVIVLDKAINNLRAAATELGAAVAILQTRLDFTEDYVEDLSVGSDKLTLADLNEEGANLVALQTRQEIGLEALKVSGDQQRAILRLIQ
ncbi:MAG: hypothetical protein AB8B77_04740 [Alphaproteobacteria bacterium]